MFLENLIMLMQYREVNKSELSRESGIPYTTIDGFFKKGCDNIKLSTLIKLSEYFNVSLDFLVNGDIMQNKKSALTLTEEEKTLLLAYRKHPEMQNAVNTLLSIEKEEQ